MRRDDTYPPPQRAHRSPTALPTPDEIAAATAEIRQGWSPEQCILRWMGPPRDWQPPYVIADPKFIHQMDR